MSEPERVPVIGGPLDGQDYPWTTARVVLIPDASDMIHAYNREWGESVTLFGEHRYEMRCYARDGKKSYQLEHAGYTKPSLRPGLVEVSFEPPDGE